MRSGSVFRYQYSVTAELQQVDYAHSLSSMFGSGSRTGQVPVAGSTSTRHRDAASGERDNHLTRTQFYRGIRPCISDCARNASIRIIEAWQTHRILTLLDPDRSYPCPLDEASIQHRARNSKGLMKSLRWMLSRNQTIPRTLPTPDSMGALESPYSLWE